MQCAAIICMFRKFNSHRPNGRSIPAQRLQIDVRLQRYLATICQIQAINRANFALRLAAVLEVRFIPAIRFLIPLEGCGPRFRLPEIFDASGLLSTKSKSFMAIPTKSAVRDTNSMSNFILNMQDLTT